MRNLGTSFHLGPVSHLTENYFLLLRGVMIVKVSVAMKITQVADSGGVDVDVFHAGYVIAFLGMKLPCT